MDKKQFSAYKAAYQELIDALLLKDDKTDEPIKIPRNISEDGLLLGLNESIALLKPEEIETGKVDDATLTEETLAVIAELSDTKKSSKKGNSKPPVKMTVVEKEEEEENNDDDDDDDNLMDDLIEAVEATEKIADLKDLVKTNDTFKPLRTKLVTFKTADTLREAMLDIIDGLEKVDNDDDNDNKPSKTPDKSEKKNTPTPPAKKAEKTPPAPKKESMSRIDAVAIALRDHKPKTVAKWIECADTVFGRENENESRMMIKYAQKVLSKFDIDFPTE